MVDVTQEDRDFMAELYLHIGRVTERDAERIRAGDWDDTSHLQLFARHRLTRPAPDGEAVVQFRKAGCADWYDGHPDNDDGGGPYETRILYTHPPRNDDVDATRQSRVQKYLSDEKAAREVLETHTEATRDRLRAWQEGQGEWFSDTVLEIVSEFITFEDALKQGEA